MAGEWTASPEWTPDTGDSLPENERVKPYWEYIENFGFSTWVRYFVANFERSEAQGKASVKLTERVAMPDRAYLATATVNGTRANSRASNKPKGFSERRHSWVK